ncbi:MAG: hypothetical protein ACTSUV_06630, partial [Candidatus Ranarchaeia archaeon]
VCDCVLNTDVNASKNMLRKGVPESRNFKKEDRGFVTKPKVIKIPKRISNLQNQIKKDKVAH